MCSGAILQSRLSKVVFGSRDEKDGAIVSNYFVFDSPCSHERPLVYGDILKDECDALLKSFFASKRK
jgi:tRNA(adenine34) deaminase